MLGSSAFSHSRREDFERWCEKQDIPGMSKETFQGIFEDLLSKQIPPGSNKPPQGCWHTEGYSDWDVVQTAVVLKSLAAIEFGAGTKWPLSHQGKRVWGGIELALSFLCGELKRTSQGLIGLVGEDVWDTCQAILAVAAFGRAEEGRRHANDINKRWKQHYDRCCPPGSPNRWCGPAYLAAIVDALQCYEALLDEPRNIGDVLAALKDQEFKKEGVPTGSFRALTPEPNIDRWQTALVLRTLSSLPGSDNMELMERTAGWLLNQVQGVETWPDPGPDKAPMFLARCLDGLRAAAERAHRDLATRIHLALKIGNKRLESYWKDGWGDLKAYTAVAEYLAGWTVRAPAGLLLQVGPILRRERESRDVPQDKDGGVRIAWLSDLHVAQQGDEQPYTMNLVRKWLIGMKYVRGNPLTQHFQEKNLGTILAEVEKRKPDHILVTGDLANYAKPEQFDRVQRLFLGSQRVMRGGAPTTDLDPNLWTILPGNHDVSDKRQAGGDVRYNLGMFFHYFADAYPGGRQSDYDEIFPMEKQLGGHDGRIAIRLISLDPNTQWPAWVVGFNARGRIDGGQLQRLSGLLAKANQPKLVLVAMHHHPIIVPEMVTDAENYFLSLEEVDGRKLVALCATSGVSAMLHGHFHKFSRWSGRVPQGNRQIQIIGASTGTMDIPNVGVEFLEFREASIDGPASNRNGLALYRCQFQTDGKWVDTYAEVFID